MCCGFGVSLRTSTYFWTLQHVFLGVVFLLACGLESFKFNRLDSDQGFFAIVSSPVIVEKTDLSILWGYGIIYFVCGMLIFHGVHKELTSLIKWTLLLYIILQLCSIGFLKSLIQKKISRAHDLSLYSEPPESFSSALWSLFQTSLIVFFILINLIHSALYGIHLMIYCYILNKSNLIIQKVVYV